jgi:hypothetical protein
MIYLHGFATKDFTAKCLPWSIRFFARGVSAFSTAAYCIARVFRLAPVLFAHSKLYPEIDKYS